MGYHHPVAPKLSTSILFYPWPAGLDHHQYDLNFLNCLTLFRLDVIGPLTSGVPAGMTRSEGGIALSRRFSPAQN